MIPQIICVVGPTATGKTKMGVALARRFGGEVVSVDSMQIYRGMAIGTAAPTPEEMEGIPHHMVGVADPAESWSVARFVSEADVCVQDILRRGRRPILVGGTGLYLESLIRGTDFAAGSADGETRQRLQQRLEQEGIIGGYTVRLHHPGENNRVQALISIQTAVSERDHFLKMIQGEPQILQCYRVTGSYNFIVKVSCPGIDALEHLLTHLQKMGNTNTQIILATPLDRSLSLEGDV